MPLFMDIHNCDGVCPEDVAKAHQADMAVQDKYGVEYKKYWFNEDRGKLFCLVDAPFAEAAARVHREAHGLIAEKLIEVDPDLVEALMGNAQINDAGAAILAGTDQRDPGVRAVMFTDMVGSTELTSKYGDDAALAMLRVHDKVVREALAEHGGREVKHTGDGIMAAFFSASSAVRAACAMQAALRKHNESGAPYPVAMRIGISAGEPVEDNDDLFGSTVQLAARLCTQAEPGQVLVTDVVAGLCIGKGLKFTELGDRQLKGFDQPIETHVVELTC